MCAFLCDVEIALQVARCTKIINPNTDNAKYVINVKQIAKVNNHHGCGCVVTQICYRFPHFRNSSQVS